MDPMGKGVPNSDAPRRACLLVHHQSYHPRCAGANDADGLQVLSQRRSNRTGPPRERSVALEVAEHLGFMVDITIIYYNS